MEAKKLLIGILAVVIIAGGGYYGYTEYISESPTEQNDQLTFEHNFPDHASYFENTEYTEETPKYNEALSKHNEIMKKTSYSFSYTRNYESGSISLDMTVNRSSKKVKFTNKISDSNQELIQESYFANGSQYARLRQGTNPNSWEYRSRETDMNNVSKTGFNELSSIQVSGSTFTYSKSIEQNGITYYVYEPEIIDEEEFKNNSWRDIDGSPESVSIDGEILVSEYGVVTSAHIEYTVEDIVVTSKYTIEQFGETQIKEPIWISEAEESDE